MLKHPHAVSHHPWLWKNICFYNFVIDVIVINKVCVLFWWGWGLLLKSNKFLVQTQNISQVRGLSLWCWSTNRQAQTCLFASRCTPGRVGQPAPARQAQTNQAAKTRRGRPWVTWLGHSEESQCKMKTSDQEDFFFNYFIWKSK